MQRRVAAALLLACLFRANYAQQSFYDFNLKTNEGHFIDFKQFKDKVVLVVNVASQCGFTPQYEALAALSALPNLVVVAAPCNQFGAQEPGSATEIANVARKQYGFKGVLLDKLDVNGANASPLYTFLKSNAPHGNNGELAWNFEKFVVDKMGKVRYRFDSRAEPRDFRAKLISLAEEPSTPARPEL